MGSSTSSWSTCSATRPPFARVEPNVLNLFPGAEGTATHQVPAAEGTEDPVRAGAVRRPRLVEGGPEGSIVQEGQVEVGSFVDTSAELLPRTSRGRRRAKHELAVDNRGNTPLNAGCSVVDPDDLLTARVDPPTMVAPPGSAVFHTIEVIPKKRFLKGPSKTIPFQVIVSGEGQPPVTTDGAMLQEQILPKWLLPAVLHRAGRADRRLRPVADAAQAEDRDRGPRRGRGGDLGDGSRGRGGPGDRGRRRRRVRPRPRRAAAAVAAGGAVAAGADRSRRCPPVSGRARRRPARLPSTSA